MVDKLSVAQTAHLTDALNCMENGAYPDGEDMMMRAEYDWPYNGKSAPVSALTLNELMLELARLIRA